MKTVPPIRRHHDNNYGKEQLRLDQTRMTADERTVMRAEEQLGKGMHVHISQASLTNRARTHLQPTVA